MSGDNLRFTGKKKQPVCVTCRNIRAQNYRDGARTERALVASCRHGHGYTPVNTGWKMVKGHRRRYCKKCQSERSAKIYRADPVSMARRRAEYLKVNPINYSTVWERVKADPEALAIKRLKQRLWREKNKERLNKKSKEWREQNPDKRAIHVQRQMDRYHKDKEVLLAKQKEWRDKNKLKLSERRRAAYQKNKEARKRYSKDYYHKNKDRVREYAKEYQKQSSDVIRVKNAELRKRPQHKQAVKVYTERYVAKYGEALKEKIRAAHQRRIETMTDGYIRSLLRNMGLPMESVTQEAIEAYRTINKINRHLRKQQGVAHKKRGPKAKHHGTQDQERI